MSDWSRKEYEALVALLPTTPSEVLRLARVENVDAVCAAKQVILSLLSERETARADRAAFRNALAAAPVPDDITEDELIRAYVRWYHGDRVEAFQFPMRRKFAAIRDSA